MSISQPLVRPIVRGKSGQKVEFGAKISVSHLKGGFVVLDVLSWDAYNEGGDLINQIEGYRERIGHYPASVMPTLSTGRVRTGNTVRNSISGSQAKRWEGQRNKHPRTRNRSKPSEDKQGGTIWTESRWRGNLVMPNARAHWTESWRNSPTQVKVSST